MEQLESRRLLAAHFHGHSTGHSSHPVVSPATAGASVHIVGSSTTYSTIQAAVDAASSGATINVDAGSYAEEVIVTKSLTIQGAQANTDARVSSRANGTGGNESIATGVTSQGLVSAAFYINANDVTINGFTVQGETDPGSPNSAGIIIAPNRAGTHIINNIVQNNVAGLFLSSNSTTDPAIIQYNIFRNNNNDGVNGGRGIYTDQSIFGSKLTNVTIDSNSFINNYGGANTTGLEAAIALEATVSGEQTGIRITNNLMSNDGKALLVFNATNLTIQSNTITGAQDQYSGTLRFEGNVQNVSIQYNSVHDNTGPAVALDSKATSGTSSGFLINFNNFYNNNAAYSIPISVVYEADDYSSTFDARNNWWGNATGPSGDGTGTGDAASAGMFQPGAGMGWKLLPGGSLLYSPWSNAINMQPGILPTAPNTLSAVTSGLAQVTLNWNDTSPSTETGFVIQRSTDGTNFTQAGTVGTGITRFIDTTAAAGTTYIYRVAATNSNGSSSFSGGATATTPIAGSTSKNLSTLTWVSATTGYATVQKNLSISGNTLTLGGVTYASGIGTHAVSQIVYNLAGGYRNFMSDIGVDEEENSKGTGHVDFQVIGDGTTLYDSGVLMNPSAPVSINVNVAGVQTLTLIATNGVSGIDYDHADWAGAALTSAPASAAPNPPTLNTPTVVSPTQMTLTWIDNSTNEAGFKIERSTDGTNFTQVGTVAVNVTTYPDSGLQANTKYYYRVRASGTSPQPDSTYSGIVSATTAQAAPIAPTLNTPTVVSSTQLTLIWVDNSTNEAGFKIERSTDGTNFTQIGTVAANVTTYPDSGLQANTKYYYRVRASGTSPQPDSTYSGIVSATTALAAPNSPTLNAPTVISSTQITVTWIDNSANEAGFKIERSTDGTNFTQIGTVAANVITYPDSGLQANTKYYYRVRAGGTSPQSDSAYSSIQSATTAQAAPIAPTLNTPTVVSPTQITLTWIDNSTNESGFKIERSADGTNFTQIGTAATNVTTYPDSGLQANTKYYYRVRASGTAPQADSSYSGIVSATSAQAAPNAPTLNTPTVVSPTQITLAWVDNSTNEAGFKIERSTDGTNFTQVGNVATNGTTYPDSGLQAATKYYYRVRASGTSPQPDSAYSAIQSATTAPAAPNAPALNQPTVVSSTQITLTWVDNSSNEAGFKIEQSTDGTNFTQIGTVGANVTTYPDSGLQPSTKYYYRVRAAGTVPQPDSAYSAIVSTTTQAAPSAPSAPIGLTATAALPTQVNLSWTNTATNATGFIIQRSTDGVNFTPIGTTLAGVTTFPDTTATPSTSYTYEVAATNSIGTSDFTTASVVTTPAGMTTTYLSDLNWASATTGYGSVQNDRSVAGNPITLNGVVYAKGIGTHAVSQIVYNLGGAYTSFISDVGVDSEENGKGTGSVDFQVIGDGTVLFDSGVLTNGSPTVSINVDVTGVQTLTLVATNGVSGSIDYDHADWAGAALISTTSIIPITTKPKAPGTKIHP